MRYMQEPVADTLEQLWISYNQIDKLKGINILRNLKVSLGIARTICMPSRVIVVTACNP